MLGAAEDQRPLDRIGLQELDQQRLLFGLVDEGHALLDALDGGRHGRDRDFGGVGQIAVGQFLDRPRHGGREEQGLALGGDQGDDALQRVDEAQVEHLVGLVEDEDFEIAQSQSALVDQVEQAAGVATRTSSPRDTSRTLLPLGTPPKMTPTDSFMKRP